MESIVRMLKNQPNFYSLQGASEEEVRQAEQALGLSFAEDYRAYVLEYGAASFAGHELTGVCLSHRLNVVNATLLERKCSDVPGDWYVLEQTNIDGIVIWQTSDGSVFQTASGNNKREINGSLIEYVSNGSWSSAV